MKAIAVSVGTILAMDLIEKAFGSAVAVAVAITGLIGCVGIFWTAGRHAQEQRGEGNG